MGNGGELSDLGGGVGPVSLSSSHPYLNNMEGDPKLSISNYTFQSHPMSSSPMRLLGIRFSSMASEERVVSKGGLTQTSKKGRSLTGQRKQANQVFVTPVSFFGMRKRLILSNSGMGECKEKGVSVQNLSNSGAVEEVNQLI
ncbi:hypothetical protein QYF36_003422 [Acer negundo]|nr:hypothetical protein QYF36_003422 [Acer negundo]